MLPNLDIDQLKAFLAIADTGNFTRAADVVNKTQSAVSMQMKRLEETLGRPLFAKDGRGIRFTADGERLVDYARRIVSLSDEAVSAFTKPDMTGTVRFGTPDDYADLILPEVLGRFHRTHPLVNVDVECYPSTILAERLLHGEFDLAVVTFGAAHIQGEILHDADIVWVTSPRHSTHLMDILPLAAAPGTCVWRRNMLETLDRIGRKYRVAYTSPNFATICAAVQQGLALAAMPDICVKPGMRILTKADGFPPLGTFDIGLIQKPGKASPAALALAQHIREGLRGPRALVAAE
ncbi:MAG: LysR family transcriptional regulator [Alphaproteobacteria bacterium]|nr:LysR family transcriptional regulator [Alphaproteobacteria bacterium]